MAQERLAPDALLEQTNLTGAVGDIDDDPDAPDASWLTAASNNADSIARTSFPTPSGSLTAGADLQEFRVQVRKMGGTGTPLARIELYENGVLVRAGSETNVTSTSGVVLAFTWNATEVSGNTNVECRLFGTKSGGSPSVRAAIEVGAAEWNAEVTAAAPDNRAEVAWAELEVPNQPDNRAEVSWAEVEIPNPDNRAELSWAELEVPTPDNRAEVAWAEVEVPLAPNRAEVAWTELEVPSAGVPDNRAEVAFAELEVPPLPDNRAEIAWAEMEVPTAPNRAEVSWAEVEVPNAANRAEVTHAEFQVPDLATSNIVYASGTHTASDFRSAPSISLSSPVWSAEENAVYELFGWVEIEKTTTQDTQRGDPFFVRAYLDGDLWASATVKPPPRSRDEDSYPMERHPLTPRPGKDSFRAEVDGDHTWSVTVEKRDPAGTCTVTVRFVAARTK